MSHQIASKLGIVDHEILTPMEGSYEYDSGFQERIQTDYAPYSQAFAILTPFYNEKGLTLVIGESFENATCVLLVARKSDIGSAILFANCLVRLITPNTPLYSSILLPDDSPDDLRLEDADPDFFCSRFLITNPSDFGINLSADLHVRFLVGTDDHMEGELSGLSLLKAIQSRTSLGISPPFIPQPFE
jgi:hypothetical protein